VARKERERIREQDITGLRYSDRLAPLLERLRDVGCERDRAGNRELHYDQYCLLVLLYLFNPLVTSLRGIQQASELAKVQKKLGCPRASLSEAATVFDAERLKEIIAELAAELQPLARDDRLPADQSLDQAQADAAHLRNDLFLLRRAGERSGTPGAPDQAQTPRRRTDQTLSHTDSATTLRAREPLDAAP